MSPPSEASSAAAVHADDESTFLSIADFFSLISLSLIYVLLSFSPTSSATSGSLDIVTGVSSGIGPASQVDRRFAYLLMTSDGSNILLSAILPGSGRQEDFSFKPDENFVGTAKTWFLAQLGKGPSPEKIFLYIRHDEPKPELHVLLHRLGGALKPDFDVSMVLLEDEENAF